MTDLKANILRSRKLRSALMLIALFSGSVLGGIIFSYISNPKEACAQCVAIPPSNGRVLGGGIKCTSIWGVAIDRCTTGGSWCPVGYTEIFTGSSGGPGAVFICITN